ncbi:MAG: spore coat protein U domain-containing protein [Rhodomicrobium sp.]
MTWRRGLLRGVAPRNVARGGIQLGAALLLLMLACFPGTAQAQLACSLSLTPVVFDTIDSLSSGTYDARGSLTVSCTGSNGAAIAACVDLQPASANAAGQLLLIAPGKGRALPIQVFQDAGLRMPWGSSALGNEAMLTRTGDGPMTAPVYARLYVQGKAAVPGTYSAQVPVTLRYGAMAGTPVNCSSLGVTATPGGKANTAARTLNVATPVPTAGKHR